MATDMIDAYIRFDYEAPFKLLFVIVSAAQTKESTTGDLTGVLRSSFI